MAASMPPVMDSSTLQDRLRTREDIDDVVRVASTGLTLGAVLGCEKRPPPGHVNRTLNDIMRDDDQPNGYKDVTSDQPLNARMTWKSFKERLRIRRAGSNWASSLPIPASDVPPAGSQLSRRQVPMYTAVPQQPTGTSEESPGAPTTLPVESVQANDTLRPELSRQDSDRAPPRTPTGLASAGTGDGAVVSRRLSAALAEERELQRAESAVALGSGHADEAEEEEEEEEGQAAPRVSLMALLEETDRQVGMVGPAYLYEEENQEEEDEDDEEGGGGGEGRNRGRIEYNCCVCMLRHKGAAFIPCGHTFCRVCSRELWVTRGNCPLCNGCILEILDIF